MDTEWCVKYVIYVWETVTEEYGKTKVKEKR